jgi:hypothetical protein
MKDNGGRGMKFLINGKQPGWRLDDNDLELAKALPSIIKAVTPLILGLSALAFAGWMAWKGHYLTSIGVTLGTILKSIGASR